MNTADNKLPTALRRMIDGTGRTPPAMRAKYLASLSAAPDDWNVSQPSRGLGDVVAKVTTRVGIKPCRGCKGRQKWLNTAVPFDKKTWTRRVNKLVPFKRSRSLHPFAYDAKRLPEFVTTAKLMEDAKALASMLPEDTSLIVGVARSGLTVANMVAMLLHRPIEIVRQSNGDVIDGGHGWRLTGNTTANGPVVVIDDTCMSGNSLKHVMPIVRKTHPNAIAAAVYCNPQARQKPDIWVRDLPWPHLLEWNLFNSILSPNMAVDFDGILCHDPPTPADDDDGPRYERFLRDTKPLYLARKVPIPLIVTARVEKYRPQTEAWLKRYGVKCSKLVMAPWPTSAERRRHDMAAFKAEHYRSFIAQHRRGLKPPLFVESDPHLAARIAKMSGGLVVCPAAGRCYK